jgi:hypothetical protein
MDWVRIRSSFYFNIGLLLPSRLGFCYPSSAHVLSIEETFGEPALLSMQIHPQIVPHFGVNACMMGFHAKLRFLPPIADALISVTNCQGP